MYTRSEQVYHLFSCATHQSQSLLYYYRFYKKLLSSCITLYSVFISLRNRTLSNGVYIGSSSAPSPQEMTQRSEQYIRYHTVMVWAIARVKLEFCSHRNRTRALCVLWRVGRVDTTHIKRSRSRQSECNHGPVHSGVSSATLCTQRWR